MERKEEDLKAMSADKKIAGLLSIGCAKKGSEYSP